MGSTSVENHYQASVSNKHQTFFYSWSSFIELFIMNEDQTNKSLSKHEFMIPNILKHMRAIIGIMREKQRMLCFVLYWNIEL